MNAAIAAYLLRLGDSALVLGHRLSQWCGHGPMLEEDIALTNIALDCLGHASVLLRLAGASDGSGRSEDQLAYFRDATEYRNVLLVERPNGDFAVTMLRQFLFSAWSARLWDALRVSSDSELGAAAASFAVETAYHLRHAREWVVRLGDGTEESRRRLVAARDELWPYTGELFARWPGDDGLVSDGVIVDPAALRPGWDAAVAEAFAAATITVPKDVHQLSGGPLGRHGEGLGYLLAEMQILARSHPGAVW